MTDPSPAVQSTAATIINAATPVLRDDPNATMIEIAQRSGIARATLYRHFPSREALVSQLVVAAATAYEEQMVGTDPETGDAREAARRATIAYLRESASWRVARYA